MLIAAISGSVMVSFIKFIPKCKPYCVTFGGASGESWLVERFYDAQMNTTRDEGQGTHMRIVFWKQTNRHQPNPAPK